MGVSFILNTYILANELIIPKSKPKIEGNIKKYIEILLPKKKPASTIVVDEKEQDKKEIDKSKFSSSFFDFYKKDKSSFFIFSAYFVTILVFFGSLETWHGFISWGPRYLLPAIPFLIIPLAASIERRNNMSFRFLIMILGTIGAFFSLMWLIQDVSWFVWGTFGEDSGLYSLGIAGMHNLSLNPLVLWTFEYSQLIQSVNLAFNHLQVDLFLFKLLGPIVTALVLSIIIIPLAFILKSVVNNNKLYANKNT